MGLAPQTMRRGDPGGAPPQVRNFMNRPIRGPAFLELDEVTGLLRPGSLAKLLKNRPEVAWVGLHTQLYSGRR